MRIVISSALSFTQTRNVRAVEINIFHAQVFACTASAAESFERKARDY
jgi:hypothetical protein